MKFVCKPYLSIMHSFSCFSPFSGKAPLKSPGFQQEFSTGRGETPPKINKIKGIYFCFPYFQQFCLLKTRFFPLGKVGKGIFYGCLNVEFPDIFPMNITKKYSPQTRGVYILLTYFRTQFTKKRTISVTEFPETKTSRGVLTVRRPGVVSADGNTILSEELRFYAF